MAKDTIRVNIALSNSMNERIDNISSQLGMTRSQLCTYFIGQGCISFEKSIAALGQIGERVAHQLIFDDAQIKIDN